MKPAASPAKPGLTCDNGATTETAPAGNRGLDTTSRSKDSVMPYPDSSHKAAAAVDPGTGGGA